MSDLPNPTASPTPGAVLKTLLLTDLVDSTRTVETLGDARSAELFALHDRAARDLLARCHGIEIDKADGFLLMFERPIDAARFALAYHDALQELSESQGVTLTSRAGVHLGEVILRHNDPEDIARGAKPVEIEGLAKPAAARVMSLATKGQTLITKAAFDLARRAAVGDDDMPSDTQWLDHGPYRFKGVDDAMLVCEVGRKGRAPLRAPVNSEKAKRAIAPGDEETLGWRPAVRLTIPGRDGWRLERKIGEGGFGEVWLARHDRTHDVRAFKFCYQADRLRSLKRELTLFRLLRENLGERPDIARLWEVRLDRAPYFLEMEYSPGGNLGDWADNLGGIESIELEQRVEIVAQVADALAAAHSVGVIHKDVKPANVLIHEVKGARPQARLTDFGIGQLVNADILARAGVTATGFTESSLLSDLGSRTGTRLYTAPELLAGKPPTIQSDIYALGVLLYQVVVGDLHRPLAQGWESDVDNPSLRSDIAACVTGSLAFRLQSADELADRLRRLDQRERDRIRAERAVRSKAIRKRVAILSALAAPLLALVAFAYWRSQESDAGRVLAELKKAIDAGVRFTENQNWDHAESAFQNAQSLKPDHPNLWFQHARMKLLQVNHVPPAEAEPLLQQAERLCSRGLEFDPDSADGLNYHGIILKKLNRFDDAIKAYESVTRLQPDYFAAWVNLGTVHALAGHPHLAEDLLTKSTEMASQDDNPDRFAYSAQAWRNLASLQLHLNNLDAARANINEALHRNRNDWSVWAVSARVDLEAPDPASHERALDDAKHADAVSGGTEPLAKRVLARACLVNDRFQDAIDAASAAMKSDENPTLCHLIIACASARLDDSDNARSALAFAEQSWPPDVRSAGQFAVSAPKGILWYDEAKTLLNLKNDAESTLYGTSP